jgi:BirA family transcriptional regulator, biotin operon repressor / biotin---[acetyl-CoA-carboxylase] ligase
LRDLDPERLSLITTALGIAVADGLEESGDLRCRLRWPNDVLVDGKKLAGILVETLSDRGTVNALIAGIGINISTRADDFPPELRGAVTSVSEVSGSQAPDRTEILATVLRRIEKELAALTADPVGIVARATDRSAVVGRDVVVRFSNGTTTSGTARALAPEGGLEIDVDGDTVVLDSAEITRIET